MRHLGGPTLQRWVSTLLLGAATVAAVPAPGTAQVPALRNGVDEPERSEASPVSLLLSFVQMRPQGEFARNVPFGYGVSGALLVGPSARSFWAVRTEFGALGYGSETNRYDGWVSYEATTSNQVFVGGIGPQLMVPRGPIRPYVAGEVGFAAFVTTTSIDGLQEESASTTNMRDVNLSWAGTAGVFIPVVRDRRQAWSFDLSVTWQRSGRATYLRKGDMVQNPDGSIQMQPVTSDTRFLGVRLGLRLGG